MCGEKIISAIREAVKDELEHSRKNDAPIKYELTRAVFLRLEHALYQAEKSVRGCTACNVGKRVDEVLRKHSR